MSLRDMLAGVMSPGGGGQQLDPAAYQKLMAENMARYHGDRDTAVMNTNIAGGFGNSTAQRFMHEGGGAPVDPMQTGAIPLPTPRPDVPLPDPTPLAATGPGIGSGIPTPATPIVGAPVPTPRPPDLPETVTLPERPGGVTMGNPILPNKAPVPTSGGQYRLQKGSGKKKKPKKRGP